MPLYHITERTTWEQAQLTGYYLPIAYHKDGFIHCSLENQVIKVANAFYRNANGLVLIKIDDSKLVSPVIMENLEGNEELFPHLYGPLTLEAVIEVAPLCLNALGFFVMPVFTQR
ncbi:MAG: DUF952 domain-containing protein [Anaerolineaceae bacterium]|nr:DUF952 domain-containing protein [Anaerolineaceae bacterium]